MDHTMPDAYTVRAAVALAVRAPSVHNSQPWQWHFDGRTVELRADPRRRLRRTDPVGRDLLVSCACALHHFTVAAAAMGWAAQVHRLPDPLRPELLARVDLVPRDTRDGDIALAAAIPRRRSGRRRFADRRLPVRDEVFLQKSASDQGAVLRIVTEAPHRSALTGAAAEAGAAGGPRTGRAARTAGARVRRRPPARHGRPRRRAPDGAGDGRRHPARPAPRR